VHEDFALEIQLATLKNCCEVMIVLLKYLIEYHLFYPWLQLVEQLVFHDHVRVLFESMCVELLYSLEDNGL
jgi:hypothetical protein